MLSHSPPFRAAWVDAAGAPEEDAELYTLLAMLKERLGKSAGMALEARVTRLSSLEEVREVLVAEARKFDMVLPLEQTTVRFERQAEEAQGVGASESVVDATGRREPEAEIDLLAGGEAAWEAAEARSELMADEEVPGGDDIEAAAGEQAVGEMEAEANEQVALVQEAEPEPEPLIGLWRSKRNADDEFRIGRDEDGVLQLSAQLAEKSVSGLLHPAEEDSLQAEMYYDDEECQLFGTVKLRSDSEGEVFRKIKIAGKESWSREVQYGKVEAPAPEVEAAPEAAAAEAAAPEVEGAPEVEPEASEAATVLASVAPASVRRPVQPRAALAAYLAQAQPGGGPQERARQKAKAEEELELARREGHPQVRALLKRRHRFVDPMFRRRRLKWLERQMVGRNKPTEVKFNTYYATHPDDQTEWPTNKGSVTVVFPSPYH